MLHGLPPGASNEAEARSEFDPRQYSLAERERAKAAELTAAGHMVTASGIKQRRQRYQGDGLVGLADGRSAKQMPAFGKRLYSKLATGTHATGSARTRRSVKARPPRPFGEVPASAPGELMQIDSTPLDVLVRLDDGIAEKVELTAMVDIATRSITAAVLRPTTKAADASALLARSVTPEAMRPGWSEALRMSRSVLPHRRLLTLDERLEHAGVERDHSHLDADLMEPVQAMLDQGLGPKQIWLNLMDDHDVSVSYTLLRHYVRLRCPQRYAAKWQP